MKKELEEQLVKKYPKLFEDYGKSEMVTCMAWGCGCGNGWYNILDNLFEELSAKYPYLILAQVKEKFGTLSVYIENIEKEDWQDVYDIKNKANELSGRTCETCGKPGKLIAKGWMRTSCDECEEEARKRFEQRYGDKEIL